MSDERLEMLDKLTQPLAEKNNVSFSTYNAKTSPPEGLFDYLALMVPAPALVADAVKRASAKRCDQYLCRASRQPFTTHST